MIAPRFVVVGKGNWPVKTAGTFTLVVDDWDDFHFKTLFMLYFSLGDDVTEIGSVKVAPHDMKEYDPHTELPKQFSELKRPFFSLGQDREYYEALMKLPGGIGKVALRSLRDVAENVVLLEEARSAEVFSISFLRHVPVQTITTQFQRIIGGQPALTPYRFSYSSEPRTIEAPPLHLEFDVRPNASPPTNVHVLIGANGVGKSKLLRDFVSAASGSPEASGTFRDEIAHGRLGGSETPFVNVVHVTFSAFDRENIVSPLRPTRLTVQTIGLPHQASESLEDQFVNSLRVCAKGRRRKRWLTAIDTLSRADRILTETSLGDLLNSDQSGPNIAAARETFESMSSGHKIALLTVTRLVELVEERSLILLDEPETHLHPPLLSALTRAISDLVIDRNGVAVVATHSPVVLQEVPRSCVWMLQRSGDDFRASQLQTESFGESVSRLTSEVFHLDVNRTGFHAMLRELLSQHQGSAQLVMQALDEQLGSEGRFVLSSLEQTQEDNVV
ncbi:ea59 protein [marine actinobacterium PHSC20C1]|nr:ea59 protein [marine actinobacterium PHSC20C1]